MDPKLFWGDLDPNFQLKSDADSNLKTTFFSIAIVRSFTVHLRIFLGFVSTTLPPFNVVFSSSVADLKNSEDIHVPVPFFL